MCNLGWCYESGNGVEQSWEEAFCWYRKGVEKGSTRAMFQLAWCYEKGLGVERDPAQAADWYRRGAEAGSTACMNNLAELLAKGVAFPRTWSRLWSGTAGRQSWMMSAPGTTWAGTTSRRGSWTGSGVPAPGG